MLGRRPGLSASGFLARALLLPGALVAGLGAPIEASAANGELASHRAAYRLMLSQVRGNAGIESAGGAMLYEVVDRCEAWTSQQRFSLSVTSRDGTTTERQSDYVTWEAKDGRSLRFRLRQIVDGQLAQSITGEARLEADGSGVVRYREPAEQEVALPAGTLFPMIHSLKIFAAARAGERALAAPLFDGTSEDGAMESNTAIVGAVPEGGERFPALEGVKSWRFRIAFFEAANTTGSPDYEVGIRYWENGIADELTMDFGDFVVEGKLDTLEIVQGGC
ncbi:cell envelope integrity EipB family protein [Elioraea rosea]|uniref:cell envelope integrity EipB family protein n=1 Tax=Elioraea rosea TaxID=2492390 RepID=UPI00131554F6|nr:cell envelope integrity EipB family protein [Elioraea rosea]